VKGAINVTAHEFSNDPPD